MNVPYIVGHPIKHPADFFGRAGQVRRFFEIVAGTQVQSTSILGLRRAGKTSFLQYVAHPETMSTYLAQPQQYVMVYLDMSSCKSPADFYGRLYRRLKSALDERTPIAAGVAGRRAQAYQIESLLYEAGDRRIVLLLDELDHLNAGGFDQDFLTELRALAGVWDYELAFVTASFWDLHRLGAYLGLPPTSPFYNIFYPSPIYLSGLKTDEAGELIGLPAERVGITADAEDVDYVLRVAGTLPFFIQATAARWLPYKRNRRLPNEDALAAQLAAEMSPFFEQWWRNFSDVERDVLSGLAQRDGTRRLSYSRQEVAEAVRRLTNYGVIVKPEDRPSINGRLFELWLREYAGRSNGNGVRRTAERSSAKPGNGHARQPEPALGEAQYQSILCTINDVGKQFERLPATYAGKGEEDLRDHFLLVLEPGFEGAATGETFNKSGKTDILIRANGSNVFIAECKFWKGPKAFLETIDQLLGYLTWRDSKAAVVVFVRNRDFTAAVRAMKEAIVEHSNYLTFLSQSDESWFNYRFHLNGDPERSVSLAVFLFHIPG